MTPLLYLCFLRVQVLLNIQLIEAQSDKHLWHKQYTREVKDIFALQMEVATKIADEIEVIVTPEEEERINKAPTDDLVAYDSRPTFVLSW